MIMILRSILVHASGENLRRQQEPLNPLGYSFDIKLPKKEIFKGYLKSNPYMDNRGPSRNPYYILQLKLPMYDLRRSILSCLNCSLISCGISCVKIKVLTSRIWSAGRLV